VNLNVSHYLTTADLEHAAHFVGLPTPVITGYTPVDKNEKVYIGGSAALIFPDPQAKASFLEFSGQGLKPLLDLLDDKELQMATLGARMLEPQTRQPASAEGQSVKRKGEESMLSGIAVVLGLGVTVALKLFVEWAGADSTKVKCELNRDFYPVPITAQELTALVQAWQTGAISDQVLFENLQAGEVIDEDTTLAQEQARRAASEPPAPAGYVPPGTQLPTGVGAQQA
jgi:hypothetical protein